MNNNGLKIIINKNDWSELPGFKMLFFIKNEKTNEIFYPEKFVFTRHEENYAIPRESLLDIPTEVAQKMMNDLWDAGLRPPYMQHTTETVVALKEHIADFRKIISKLLKLE